MKKIFASAFTFLGATALLAACAIDPSPDSLPEKIIVAGVSLDSTKEAFESYDLLVSELSRELGIPVEYYPTDSGAAVAEAVISGRVDVALLSATGYLGVRKLVDNFDLVGVTLRIGESTPGYFSYGITPKDSSIFSLEDLSGQRVCFGQAASTTGDLLPTAALLQVGIESRFDQEPDLERINTGSSSLSFGGVRDGDCIAGFATDSFFEVLMPEQGELNPDDYRVFWKSDRVPGAPLVVRNDLPGDLSERIKSLLLDDLNKTRLVETGVCSSESQCDYLASNLWGFVAAEPSQYDFLAEACARTGYDICN